MTKPNKHERAINLLVVEMGRLGGIVFARWIANSNEDAKKSIEATEFLSRLLEGKLQEKDKDYLLPYLEPLYEIDNAIKVLSEDHDKTK